MLTNEQYLVLADAAKRSHLIAVENAIRELVAANEALAKDASRYQHLMEFNVYQIAEMLGVTYGSYTPKLDTINRVSEVIDESKEKTNA